ncbi:hypothetical protein BO70DRAFT_5883 [Aspergillus heteromorphus CBS 117.55]|uniref:Uncharacterized protein n=1 Tax=Aspergillus heteromorphus CBS 117.55 TaxID=1448321 RepID=A0A317X3N5_9EURO|nr:uncharacterized protein BO70DRAFT_5883 [Aspergillus heteromorphus CBS 117.55]PWY92232.1 hypothetical protein BO70DRAFT_5883 [Aspergillus heteromorphus CBS 117.55]
MRGSPSSGAKPEKTMSSRLLTMKFMQRAAATNAAKEPSQPASAEESKIATPKRQRLSTGPGESPIGTPQSDLDAISAALAEEEEKRREALSRQALDSGDTEWVLDYAASPVEYAPPPFVVADESLDADDDDLAGGGRQAYGNFKRKKKTATGEEVNEEDIETKKESKTSRVKVSQLTSISGGRQSTMGGEDKKQKKRKHK